MGRGRQRRKRPMVRDARLRRAPHHEVCNTPQPRPEEARSAVSKNGPRATAAQAAHGSAFALRATADKSRRALRALLTMRCSPIILALLLLASLVATAPAHEPDERAVAPDAGAYR